MLRLTLVQLRIAAVFAALVLPATLVTIAIPRLRTRRVFARRTARLAFSLAGMPLTVNELTHLPDGPCVVVANHASYLDGIVMMATLPPQFSFLIKAEMAQAPLIGLLLRRLGMAFVSRKDPRRAASAATRLIRAARRGNAIGIFPEGTFRREPGLRHFHLGAFVAATRADMPLVPVNIRGTRDILPADRWYFENGAIQVTVLPPIHNAEGAPGREGAEQLRRAARAAILDNYDEPDLTAGSAPVNPW